MHININMVLHHCLESLPILRRSLLTYRCLPIGASLILEVRDAILEVREVLYQ